MNITETSAEMEVAGGLLCLKRPGLGYPWEISLFERFHRFVATSFSGVSFCYEALSPHHYAEKTFAEPIDAAMFIRSIHSPYQ